MIRLRFLAASLGMAAVLSAQSLVQKAGQVASPRSNPMAADENARLAGAKLYKQNCSSCHGEAGAGNGRKRTPPVATAMVKHADPGTLFWILRNGSRNQAMPSFAHLPEPQRWQLITYLQSLP